MSEVYSITEGYRVGFSRQIALLEENFPNPVIQMEIDFHNVPWVLDIPDLSKHTNLQRIFLIDTGIDTKALPNDLQDKVCNWDDR